MNGSEAGFPRLQSGRLVLRRLVPGDADALFALRADPETVRYTGTPPYTAPAQAADYIARHGGEWQTGESWLWALCRPGDAAMMGGICLWNPSPARDSYEIGYELLPAHRGQGYMAEAVRAVARWAFTGLGLAALRANPHGDNAPSVRLLTACGFRRVAREERPGGAHLVMELKKEPYNT